METKMASDIPRARQLLRTALALRPDHDVAEYIKSALNCMTREYNKPRAEIEAKSITKEIADDVLHYYHQNPTTSCKKIGEIFDINQGRVSEIIAGKYTA